MQLYSGDARVFGRLCCRPRQSDAATDILMVTTMALVWTVTNVTLYAKLRCNYAMQIPAESVLRCIRQFARSGQISEFHIFALPNTARCTVPPGAHAPLPFACIAACGGFAAVDPSDSSYRSTGARPARQQYAAAAANADSVTLKADVGR